MQQRLICLSYFCMIDDIDIDSLDDDFDFEEEDDYEERLQRASAAAIARFTEGDLAGAAGQLVPIWKENPDHEGIACPERRIHRCLFCADPHPDHPGRLCPYNANRIRERYIVVHMYQSGSLIFRIPKRRRAVVAILLATQKELSFPCFRLKPLGATVLQ